MLWVLTSKQHGIVFRSQITFLVEISKSVIRYSPQTSSDRCLAFIFLCSRQKRKITIPLCVEQLPKRKANKAHDLLVAKEIWNEIKIFFLVRLCERHSWLKTETFSSGWEFCSRIPNNSKPCQQLSLIFGFNFVLDIFSPKSLEANWVWTSFSSLLLSKQDSKVWFKKVSSFFKQIFQLLWIKTHS